MATERIKQVTGIPTGVFMPFAGTVAPAGFLICDGAAISRTTHAALFAVIGTTYGIGDGSTTFNIPDLRACTPVGAGTSTKFTTNETKTLGTYENDKVQDHGHNLSNWSASQWYGSANNGGSDWLQYVPGFASGGAGSSVTSMNSGRIGTTTQGKQVVSNYIIKT
jgi:microcystin-dependent protein